MVSEPLAEIRITGVSIAEKTASVVESPSMFPVFALRPYTLFCPAHCRKERVLCLSGIEACMLDGNRNICFNDTGIVRRKRDGFRINQVIKTDVFCPACRNRDAIWAYRFTIRIVDRYRDVRFL